MVIFICYFLLFIFPGVCANEVGDEFDKAHINADLGIKSDQTELLKAKYGNNNVRIGETLQKSGTSEEPSLKWKHVKDKLVTIIMLDPDAPSRSKPKYRSWLHWLVVDVKENDISGGKTIVSYAGPTPPSGSGPHRYVLLVYKQNGSIGASSHPQRPSFNVSKFASEHGLGDPLYGNFFKVVG